MTTSLTSGAGSPHNRASQAYKLWACPSCEKTIWSKDGYATSTADQSEVSETYREAFILIGEPTNVNNLLNSNIFHWFCFSKFRKSSHYVINEAQLNYFSTVSYNSRRENNEEISAIPQIKNSKTWLFSLTWANLIKQIKAPLAIFKTSILVILQLVGSIRFTLSLTEN